MRAAKEDLSLELLELARDLAVGIDNVGNGLHVQVLVRV
jgi:hypothetical protein